MSRTCTLRIARYKTLPDPRFRCVLTFCGAQAFTAAPAGQQGDFATCCAGSTRPPRRNSAHAGPMRDTSVKGTLKEESVMAQGRLHPSSRLFEADWLAARRAPFNSYSVASVVTGGFPAYVRIPHPAHGMHGERLRWAEVALKSDRTMHRLAQFHAINRPSISGLDIAPPEPGNLPSDLLRVVCAALAEHTSTPGSCWFCLWNGHGFLHDTAISVIEFRPVGVFPAPSSTPDDATHSSSRSPHVPDDWLKAATVNLPARDYLLFEGPLEAASELGWKMSGGVFVPQSPNLFWPQDHAWCVASEIDLLYTLVAGSNALAESLLADPRLEVWRVFPDDPVTADSDDMNT